MSLMVVEDGLMQFLLDWATKANTEEYKIGLYQNDWTPAVGDDLADVTPASYGGYSGLQVLDSWDTGGMVFTSPRAIVNHPPITWTADGASTNTIYGYYVTNNAGTLLLWAERRATGGVLIGSVPGQTYTVVPKMTDRTE